VERHDLASRPSKSSLFRIRLQTTLVAPYAVPGRLPVRPDVTVSLRRSDASWCGVGTPTESNGPVGQARGSSRATVAQSAHFAAVIRLHDVAFEWPPPLARRRAALGTEVNETTRPAVLVG